MTPKDYQEWVPTKDRTGFDYLRLGASLPVPPLRQMHAALGMAGEVGEVVDMIKKNIFYGKPLDAVHIREEVGDLLWYTALLLNSIGATFEEVMEENRQKLDKRFPTGYSNSAAMAREDKNGKA